MHYMLSASMVLVIIWTMDDNFLRLGSRDKYRRYGKSSEAA